MERRPRAIELWLLVGLAAAVRFYGLRFGLPHVYARPDELVVCDIGQRILGGDLNPHFWDYPTLFMYILAAADYLYYLFGGTVGWFASLDQFLATWRFDWAPFFMTARVVSATAGVATVAVVHRLAIRLFDRLTADMASFFLALAFLHVRDSHFGVTDVAMTFLAMSAALFLVRGALEGGRRWFAIAGGLAGAGASIKYNVVFMIVAALAAAIVYGVRLKADPANPPDVGSGFSRTARSRLVATGAALSLFTACFVAAFIAGSPYAVLDAPAFVNGLLSQMRHVATAHGYDLGRGGVYHVVFSLRYGVGLPLLAAGIAGFAWLTWRDWRKALLLGSFPLVYYLVLIPSRTVFVRYAIPLVPFLCITAAALVAAFARQLGRHSRSRATAVAVVASLVIVAPSAYSVAQIDRLFREVDTRVLAADWIRANVPAGSSIYFAGNIVSQPIVDLGPKQTLRYWTHFGGATFSEGRPARPVAGVPEWIVIPESGVPEYSYCPPEVKELARERYDVARVFNAMDLASVRFDRQDAFYYPYAGFRAARRGGPNYTIYVRRGTGIDVR